MNKRQAKKEKQKKQEAWYVIIEYGRNNGTLLDPYPCRGYIEGKYFVDVGLRKKYRLNNIKKYVFPNLVEAANWVEKKYGRWACSHMLKALPLI